MGRLDDPFFGFVPPLVSFPPWWRRRMQSAALAAASWTGGGRKRRTGDDGTGRRPGGRVRRTVRLRLAAGSRSTSRR